MPDCSPEASARCLRSAPRCPALVEQNAAVALDIADHAYVLENGRIVLAGTPDELRRHPDIREFYLGFGGERQRSYRDVKQYRRRRRWYG